MCHGAQARIAARRNPVAQGNTKVIYPVIHAGFENWLGTVFFSYSAFICVVCRRGVVTSEHSWSQNITVLKANAGLCTEERGGFGSWLCISFLRVTVAAKYTRIPTTGRGWIATIMWGLCMSTCLIIPHPRTEPSGREPGANRGSVTSSRLDTEWPGVRHLLQISSENLVWHFLMFVDGVSAFMCAGCPHSHMVCGWNMYCQHAGPLCGSAQVEAGVQVRAK